MLNDILAQLHYIPLAIFLTIFFIIAYIFIKENNEKAKEKFEKVLREDRWNVAFLFYLALLLSGTLLGRPHTNPFVNILGHFGSGEDDSFFIDGFVNVLIFIPYTYLFIQAYNTKKPVRDCFYLSTATTLIIELCQLLFWIGQFSVGDIVYNIIGGMIGCVIWYIVNRVFRHLRNIRDE